MTLFSGFFFLLYFCFLIIHIRPVPTSPPTRSPAAAPSVCWSEAYKEKYLTGPACGDTTNHKTRAAAEFACIECGSFCGGIISGGVGHWEIREGSQPIGETHETSYVKTTCPDDAEDVFLYKKKKQELTTKPCSFLRKKSETVQRNVCTLKKYQKRYSKKTNRLPPASVACRDSICEKFCVKEFSKAKFLFKSNTKSKAKIEVVHDCNWLKKNPRKHGIKFVPESLNTRVSVYQFTAKHPKFVQNHVTRVK